MLTKSLNISIRLFTLGVRFVFVLLLAKYLSVDDVAMYGYIVAIVGYFIYVVGVEFYTYSTRKLIIAPEEQYVSIIFNQFFLYSVFYLVSIPVLFYFISFLDLDTSVVILICAIAVLEHVCQEWNRILISLEKVTLATTVLFIRGGLWSVVVALLILFDEGLRGLSLVLYGWLIGLLLALMICLYEGIKMRGSISLDFSWLKTGIISCMVLFVASLCTKGILTFDRFFIGYLSSSTVVASYVIYMSFGNAIISAIDAAVVSFMYPQLIKFAHLKEKNNFDKSLLYFKLGCWSISLAGIIILLFIGEIILSYFDNDAYLDNIDLLKWVMLAVFLNVIVLPYHIGLYSFNQDKIIMWVALFSFMLFLIVSLVTVAFSLCYELIIYSVVFSSLISFLLKYWFYQSVYKDWFCCSGHF